VIAWLLSSCLDFNAMAQEVPPAYIEPGYALRFYPGDEDTRLGRVHLASGNYGLAEQHYRRAVEATRQNGSAWIPSTRRSPITLLLWMPDWRISTALGPEVPRGRRHLSALPDHVKSINRKGSARIQRFGAACRNRKSRATFAGLAPAQSPFFGASWTSPSHPFRG
jgi:hypothetical protein